MLFRSTDDQDQGQKNRQFFHKVASIIYFSILYHIAINLNTTLFLIDVKLFKTNRHISNCVLQKRKAVPDLVYKNEREAEASLSFLYTDFPDAK